MWQVYYEKRKRRQEEKAAAGGGSSDKSKQRKGTYNNGAPLPHPPRRHRRGAAVCLSGRRLTTDKSARHLVRAGWDDENYDYVVKNGELFNERYTVSTVIGKGSFGQVVKALDNTNQVRTGPARAAGGGVWWRRDAACVRA